MRLTPRKPGEWSCMLACAQQVAVDVVLDGGVAIQQPEQDLLGEETGEKAVKQFTNLAFIN